MPATESGPTRTRAGCVTGMPAASIMRRTIRFMPSCTTTDSSTPSGGFADDPKLVRNDPLAVDLDAVAHPAHVSSDGRFAGVRTWYSFVSPYRGCMTRLATSPSFVKSSKPFGVAVEPAHGNQPRLRREEFHHRSPVALVAGRRDEARWLVHHDVSKRLGAAPACHRPESWRARDRPRVPSWVTTCPSTVTRPARISSSALRREATPAAASTRCNRSPPGRWFQSADSRSRVASAGSEARSALESSRVADVELHFSRGALREPPGRRGRVDSARCSRATGRDRSRSARRQARPPRPKALRRAPRRPRRSRIEPDVIRFDRVQNRSRVGEPRRVVLRSLGRFGDVAAQNDRHDLVWTDRKRRHQATSGFRRRSGLDPGHDRLPREADSWWSPVAIGHELWKRGRRRSWRRSRRTTDSAARPLSRSRCRARS